MNALANLVNATLAKEFAGASRRPRIALAHLRGEIAGLGLPKLPKDDTFRHAEIRSWVATLPLAERLAALAEDAEIRSVILDQIPGVSGIPKAEYERFKQATIRELHGAKIDEIEATIGDYANAQALSDMVKSDLQRASGLSPNSFNIMVKSFEDQADRGAA